MEFFMTIVLCSICTTRQKVHQHHSQAQKGLLDVMNEPTAGVPCYKDGAGTGTTTGVIWQTEIHEFRRRTSSSQSDESTIDHSCLLVLNQSGPNRVCMSEYSDSAVFCADEHRDGWLWDGNLVSIVNENGKAHGLIVPQSEVLASLEEASGKTWCLSG